VRLGRKVDEARGKEIEWATRARPHQITATDVWQGIPLTEESDRKPSRKGGKGERHPRHSKDEQGGLASFVFSRGGF